MSNYRRSLVVVVALLSLTATTGCDKSATGPGVAVTVRFYNGATPAGASSIASSVASSAHLSAAAVAANGDWLLSPDKVALTVTRIWLVGPTPSPNQTVHCAVTFDRSKPGLTQLADCPFTVPPGTYTKIGLALSSTYEVLLNDAANGFYSTASGIVTSPPAGGAQNLSVTLNGGNGGEISLSPLPLPTALTISDTSKVNLSVVVNGLQFFHVSVSGGTVAKGWPGTSFTDPFSPDLVASVGSLARVAFYASQALGTAGSYCAGNCVPLPPQVIPSVSVYYTSATTPAEVAMQMSGASRCMGSPGSGSGTFVNDPRSFLGLDASGILGWATATDTNWSTYFAEFRMAQVTALNGTTTLYCQNISANPAPPGGSFASGAPSIASSANSLGTYILLAR